MKFLLQLLNGVQIGAIYALVALGYSMVYGVVRLINFAHGEIIMLGSYAAWYLISRAGLNPYLAALCAVVFCAAMGMFIEKVAYKPLRASARLSLLITAIGVSLLLQNLVQLIFSADPRMFQSFISGSFTVGGRQYSAVSVITIIVSVLFMVLITFMVNRTKIGKSMRAVSQDRQAALLMGINVNTTISFTFAVGSALAAVASVLYCCSYSQISPTMGSMFGLKAFVAAVLGGIGSIPRMDVF